MLDRGWFGARVALMRFADDISKASLDVHIVMMTTSASIPVICPVVPADPRYKFIEIELK